MKIHSFFILIIGSIIVTSCKNNRTIYQDETLFSWNDFKVELLKGKNISFDEPIMKPLQIMVIDTLLITINQGTEKHCHLFNLKTKKKIGERIAIGQGPDEMLVPSFISSNDSIRLYDMMTSSVYSFGVSEFVSNIDAVPSRKYKLNETNFFSELAMLNEKLIGVSYRPDYPCYLFDGNGHKIGKGFGSYPAGPEKYSNEEIINAYRAILTSNRKNRVAVCHFFTDLIDVYNENGTLIKRLCGPEHFYTRFHEYNDGERIGSKPDSKYYRDAFYSPVSVEKDFFVLFNGKFVDKDGYNILAKDLLVFSWNGIPEIHYKLDQGVSRIAVDYKRHRIYGISDTPEYHIVEFSY